jgi:hypothetical protein
MAPLLVLQSPRTVQASQESHTVSVRPPPPLPQHPAPLPRQRSPTDVGRALRANEPSQVRQPPHVKHKWSTERAQRVVRRWACADGHNKEKLVLTSDEGSDNSPEWRVTSQAMRGQAIPQSGE